MSEANSSPRRARIERRTAETGIVVEIDLDGSGRAEFATGVPFLDHMLDQVARHGMIDLVVKTTATCTSTPTTRSRTSASRSARRWPRR
jgi:imidazoleglycerol phosphate dehydratase HisB